MTPAVLQRTLTVNGTDLPVIGVAPEGFGGVFTSGEPQLWITFALSDLVFRDATGRPVHARGAGAFNTTLVGRLRPGATIEQASAQGAALAGRLYEANDRGREATLRSGRAAARRGASAVLAVCCRLDVGTADRPRHRLRERGQPPAGARDAA